MKIFSSIYDFTPRQKSIMTLGTFDGVHIGHKKIIEKLIAQDPRVAYRQAEIEVVSTMRYGAVDVDFWMDEMGVMVITGLRVVDE